MFPQFPCIQAKLLLILLDKIQPHAGRGQRLEAILRLARAVEHLPSFTSLTASTSLSAFDARFGSPAAPRTGRPAPGEVPGHRGEGGPERVVLFPTCVPGGLG